MPASELAAFAEAVSLICGWIYFVAWSLSFYPQPIHNWQRKSTVGLAVDFSAANFIGLSAYTAYTAALSFSPVIRQEYALRNGDRQQPAVRFNDFVYGVHAVLLVVISYSQFWPRLWGFTVGKNQRVSPVMRTLCIACIAVIATAVAVVAFKGEASHPSPSDWMWLDVIYVLGYIKLIMTIIKYAPQVYLNHKRQSTSGYRMEAVYLDVLGGVLSLTQLFIDASLADDWSAVMGNPAKFALGNITLVFDAIFVIQHCLWYGANRRSGTQTTAQADEDSPLLESGREGIFSYS